MIGPFSAATLPGGVVAVMVGTKRPSDQKRRQQWVPRITTFDRCARAALC